MRERFDDPRLPSRADIEFQRAMDEDEAVELEEVGYMNGPEPSDEEKQAIAEAHLKAEAAKTPADRLMEELGMLTEEEKGLAMDNPCTIFHCSGLVHGKTYARLSEPDHASDEGTGLITSLWYWDEQAHDLKRYEPIAEVMAVHFPNGTKQARHWDGTWFRMDQ